MQRQKNGTGTVVKRNNMVEYRVSLGIGMDGKPLRKSFYGKTEKIAIDKYKLWLKNSDNITIERVKTVGEWADKWLELYKKGKVEFSTYRNYEMYVNNHIKPALGHLKFEQVRPAHIQRFFSERNNLSQSAKRHINITLKGIFDSAVENRYCTDNPIKPLKGSVSKEETIKVFTVGQITKVLKDCETHKFGAYVQLLLYTGMRMGELLALQWGNIDKENALITIDQAVTRQEGGGYAQKKPKSGKARFIGISEKLQIILDNLPKTGIYVLTGEHGARLTPKQFEKRYKQFFVDTGNDYLSAHKCRHTYATYLVKGGADLRSIQNALGHSALSVTEVYTHIDTTDIKNNIKKLGY